MILGVGAGVPVRGAPGPPRSTREYRSGLNGRGDKYGRGGVWKRCGRRQEEDLTGARGCRWLAYALAGGRFMAATMDCTRMVMAKAPISAPSTTR